MSLFKKKDVKKTEQEKVAERREEVLARGRKFKYPLQWTKHRVVMNTVLIAFVVTGLVATAVWLGLYRMNMTDDLLYRIVEVVPVSVAKVDGENVRFSDYLTFYRSSMTSIEQQSGSQMDEDEAAQLKAEYQRAALTEAERYSYALKLARENGVSVSDEDVAAEYQRHLKVGGVDRSEAGFVKILKDSFGLTKAEYERLLYLTLAKAKVEAEIDTVAKSTVQKVEQILASSDNDYQKVVEELGELVTYEETGGLVDNKNIDGGRATEAMKLEPGESSEKFISLNGDGYYFVKLVEKTTSEVNFISLKVPFTKFDELYAEVESEGKIEEYIEIDYGE